MGVKFLLTYCNLVSRDHFLICCSLFIINIPMPRALSVGFFFGGEGGVVELKP